MKAGPRILIAVLLLLLAPASEVSAQYPFGKNKIQYTPKDWKIIETAHFEIFYYPEEIAVAEFIAEKSEDIYTEYSEFFGLEFDRKIPVVLYGTHHDFQETNIISPEIANVINAVAKHRNALRPKTCCKS